MCENPKDKNEGIIYLNEKERTDQIIRPILRGRDIKRYAYEWGNIWLLFIPWHFPNTLQPKSMEENEKDFTRLYPQLYNHLLEHKNRLSKRNQDETGIRYEWYCLQRWGANYFGEFNRQKIVWNPVSGEYFFAYIKDQIYFNNSLFMITKSNTKKSSNLQAKNDNFLIYLLGLMNSTLYKWLIIQMTNLIQVGQYAYGSKDKIENLPIPQISAEEENKFVEIVEQILEAKKQHHDTQTLEKQLDTMVFALYALTDEEIKIITSDFL
ncbi:TaqI-like C-terminal specificity domain-containing protein [Helicobacter sp. 11S02596-1]|uniref:TaqI-like C-terminal specificity domain-containing protein n=1 Tax=Helicobacter sp. 11S02596-1 TaxID=1476194 RepID=UPI0026A9D587